MKRSVASIFLLLAACSPDLGDKPTPNFWHGEIVEMKAFPGVLGMVLGGRCWRGETHCRYHVRFNAVQLTTNTSLLSEDGPINRSPVAVVSGIRGFEIKSVHRRFVVKKEAGV